MRGWEPSMCYEDGNERGTTVSYDLHAQGRRNTRKVPIDYRGTQHVGHFGQTIHAKREMKDRKSRQLGRPVNIAGNRPEVNLHKQSELYVS